MDGFLISSCGQEFSAADKVVGRATAFLYVLEIVSIVTGVLIAVDKVLSIMNTQDMIMGVYVCNYFH